MRRAAYTQPPVYMREGMAAFVCFVGGVKVSLVVVADRYDFSRKPCKSGVHGF